jgi:dolichol-phosphate mannosyltransferase
MNHGSKALERNGAAIAVVIPSFRASRTIENVILAIGSEVTAIYVVDDGCPEFTDDQLSQLKERPRTVVLNHQINLGVGGAMKTGYRRAMADGADIIVKIDADGQMNPTDINMVVAPILAGHADYAKGNRFIAGSLLPAADSSTAGARMPLARRLANLLLSATHHLATGYREVRDPANGFTAIHSDTLRMLDLDRVSNCFFFETDMLHHLNSVGAVVREVPLLSRYGGQSTLRLVRVAPTFIRLLIARAAKRLWSRWTLGAPRPRPPEPLWCRQKSC